MRVFCFDRCWHSVLKRATLLDTPSTFLRITRRTSLWPPPRSRMHMRGRAAASIGPCPLSCGSLGVFSGPVRAPSALWRGAYSLAASAVCTVLSAVLAAASSWRMRGECRVFVRAASVRSSGCAGARVRAGRG